MIPLYTCDPFTFHVCRSNVNAFSTARAPIRGRVKCCVLRQPEFRISAAESDQLHDEARNFWPQSVSGAVLVTSKVPGLRLSPGYMVPARSSLNLTLAELYAMADEDRFDWILQQCGKDISAAIRSCSNPVFQVSAERVAWAFAFNCEKHLQKEGTRTQWGVFWAQFAAPGGPATARLTDFILSVAAEARSNWQYPYERPVDPKKADIGFYELYKTNAECVLRSTVSRLRDFPGIEADDVAQEAWMRAYNKTWSVAAQRRFCGRSRISTYVGGFVKRIIQEHLRKQERLRQILGESKTQGVIPFGGLRTQDGALVSGEVPIEQKLISKEHLKRVLRCINNLPEKEQKDFRDKYVRGMKQTEIAEARGVSKPAVTKSLNSAMSKLWNWLQK